MTCKLNKKEVELFVSIVNTLIEKLPQDEYDFDDSLIGYYTDDKDIKIVSGNGDELSDTLEWVLKDVISEVCKE